MAANLETIADAIKALKTTEIVSCPLNPIQVVGVSEVFNEAFTILLPKYYPDKDACFDATEKIVNAVRLRIILRDTETLLKLTGV